jgi:predicted esterase
MRWFDIRIALLPLLACQPVPAARSVASDHAEPAEKAETREGVPSLSSGEPSPEQPASAEPQRALSTESELVPLAVPGFLEAVVALPIDGQPRPLLVATHGAGGDPAWTCREWARRVAAAQVVLCPRGRAISVREDYGFYYPDHRALTAEVLAAVAALRAAHAARLADGPALYTAYSQGASMGSLGLVEHAAEFPRLILTEGGFKEWSPKSARRFAQNGGKRVLFVCGGRGCQAEAEKSARILHKAGVETRVEYVPNGGHTDGGAVGKRLDQVFGWALEGAAP